MIIGATYLMTVRTDVTDITMIDKAIFTMVGGSGTLTRVYPSEVSFDDGAFFIPLTQEDTIELGVGNGELQAQINFAGKAVAKTYKENFYIDSSLATEIVDGNYPSAYQLSELHIKVMDGVIIAHVNVEEVDQIVAELHDVEAEANRTIEQTAAAGASAKAKGDYAERQGNDAQIKGLNAEAKGNYAEQQGDAAKREAEAAAAFLEAAKDDVAEVVAKGDKAQKQGNIAESQGNYAASQGNYAEQQGNEALSATNAARAFVEEGQQTINNTVTQAQASVAAAVGKAEKVNATVSKSGKTTTLTVTDHNGTNRTAQIIDGADGVDGKDYVITEADYQTIADKVETEYTVELGAIKEEIDNLNDRIDHVDEVIIETVEPLQKQADATDRSLDALWKLNKGQTYDIDTQTESGMNDAPSGAEYLSLEEVYGKSEQETTHGYNLIDAGVMTTPEIQSVGYFNPPYVRLNNTVKLKAGVTYTIYCFARKYGDSIIRWNNLRYSSNSGEVSFGGFTATDVTKEGSIEKRNFTPTEDYEGQLVANHQFYCANYVNPTSVELVWQMVVEGNPSTTPEYEPYTNGASPNPEYPQPITSVEEINIDVNNRSFVGFIDSCNINANGMLASSTEFALMVFRVGKNSSITSSVYGIFESIPTIGDTAKDGIRHIDETIVTDGLTYVCVRISKSSSNTYFYVDGERIECNYSQKDGWEFKTTTITPPFPLNAIDNGDNVYRDMIDVENGVWRKKCKESELDSAIWRYDTPGKLWVSTDENHKYTDGLPNSYMMGETFVTRRVAYGRGTLGSLLNAPYNVWVDNGSDTVQPRGKCIYVLAEEQTFPISASDLDFLKSLELTPADHHITVTSQTGEPIEWLAEYIISLREVH